MRRSIITAAALIATLGACSPAAEKKTDAAAAPAVVAKPGAMMTPGQWRTTVTITAMSVPGVPPEAVATMKTRPFTSEECVTSDDLGAYLDKRSANNPDNPKNCVSKSTDYSNGRITSESVCTDASGHPSTVKIAGTYGPERMDMTVNVDGEGARGPQSQTMALTAERIGACP